ncbi:MAG: hypothetical protein KBA91_02070, partial [Candidatus Moranbacteria bacterium]|nr:hypothetical protein [Candidatus Moranbacteria bacterium]
ESRTCESWGLGTGTGYVDVNSCTGLGSNYDTSGCSGGACTPDSSCAATTCSGQSCQDACGNWYAGTKSCPATTYTIIATSGIGGSIAPAGTISNIAEWSDQSFTITPNATYVISDVLIDGFSIGPVGTYIFNNITSHHTISVSFVGGGVIPTLDVFTGTYGAQINQTILALPAGGGNVTLNWATSNTIGGTCTGYGGNFAGAGKSVNGTQMVIVPTTTTFTLDCWDASWMSTGQRSVTVTVAGAPTPAALHICPPSATIDALGPVQNLRAWYTPAGTNFISCANTTGAINRT